MNDIAPGWYKDPAEPTTQRYWDGEGWLGGSLPADAVPPVGPLPEAAVDPTIPLPLPLPVTPAPGPTPPAAPPAALPPLPPPPPTPAGPPAGAPPWATGPGGQPVPYRGGPPPRPHGLTLAHPGARLVARIVDILAVLVLAAVANAWIAREFWAEVVPIVRQVQEAQRTGGAMPDTSEVNLLFFYMCVVAFLVWFAYEVPSTANSGQTLGKKILGIKVVRLESGEQLGFGRSLRRWSRLGVPTLLWPCCGAGFVLQVIDCFFVAIDRPLHQALHDKGAATVVVEVPRPGSKDAPPLEKANSGGHDAHPR